MKEIGRLTSFGCVALRAGEAHLFKDRRKAAFVSFQQGINQQSQRVGAESLQDDLLLGVLAQSVELEFNEGQPRACTDMIQGLLRNSRWLRRMITNCLLLLGALCSDAVLGCNAGV